jgi:anti-sigma regulatory factor (Ser/Thr protein kinase)
MREISSIEIRDEAQVGAARRAVHGFASGLGFDETELAEIDIVVQEIGTNAATHATLGGTLHFTQPFDAAQGLELFYRDAGPGIYNLDRAIRDGVSTSGTLGAGLGAIRRLMDEFDVYSTVRKTERLSLSNSGRTMHGTALLARKWVGGIKAASEETRATAQRLGLWSRPHPREEINGDAYFISTRDARTLYAVIDGLGHGRGAHEAASVALDTLKEWRGESLDAVMQAAHESLRRTRGAVMGATVIDRDAWRFDYAGVGNIGVRVFDAPENVNPISNNGTLGARLGKVRVWSHAWAEGATIILSSDGISESWSINSYPDILRHSPQLLAGVLMRDYARDSDDATVMIIK